MSEKQAALLGILGAWGIVGLGVGVIRVIQMYDLGDIVMGVLVIGMVSFIGAMLAVGIRNEHYSQDDTHGV